MNSRVIVALVILILAAVALIYLEMNSRRNSRAAERSENDKAE